MCVCVCIICIIVSIRFGFSFIVIRRPFISKPVPAASDDNAL